jgi:hypothetical protein
MAAVAAVTAAVSPPAAVAAVAAAVTVVVAVSGFGVDAVVVVMVVPAVWTSVFSLDAVVWVVVRIMMRVRHGDAGHCQGGGDGCCRDSSGQTGCSTQLHSRSSFR